MVWRNIGIILMTKVKQWREWLVLGWETGTFASFRLRHPRCKGCHLRHLPFKGRRARGWSIVTGFIKI